MIEHLSLQCQVQKNNATNDMEIENITVNKIDLEMERTILGETAGLLFSRRLRAVEDRNIVSPSPKFSRSETIIYEVHLRDFSSDPNGGVGPKGKYSSLGATGLRHLEYKSLKTGLDHLKELGINSIQILHTHFF